MVSEQIERRGLCDRAVLAAMERVPRHLFVPGGLAAEAYIDAPLPIGWGQTISQPFMVALMTALAAPTPDSRVLDVGAGSGYQTAVLAELAGEVCAIERLVPLAERARRVLQQLGYRNVRLAIGDGSRGWPEAAPFDAIVVAAAVPAPPPGLLGQLAQGGRLVIPLGRPHGDQVLTVFTRVGDRFEERHDTRCRFVPLVCDETPDGEAGAEGGTPCVSGARRYGVEPAGSHMTATEEMETATEETGMKSVRVRVSGVVQGVYYRASALREARRLGVCGWVRNRPDGTVEAHLQGPVAAVDAMLEWCRSGPPAARVERVEVQDAAPDPTLTGFEVR